MRYFVSIPGPAAGPPREVEVDVVVAETGALSVAIAGRAVSCDVVALAGGRTLSMLVGSHVVDLTVEGSPPSLGLIAGPTRVYVHAESERMRLASHAGGKGGAAAGDGVVHSPMPGRVVRVLVASGDAVEAGTPVIVVEAMKMENELKAPRTGVVADTWVAAGDTVVAGQKLLRIDL